ncbi:MAG: aminotransferase class V-fold PLP-dependent enzyme [Bacilli bacterium]|jgi:cysteine desulfurase/selenocysteine lyase
MSNEFRKDFPMLNPLKEMQGHPLVYLDSASTSLKPQVVIDAITDYYQNYSVNAHRGDYDLAHHVDEMVESCRQTVADFINASDREIVFTSGTTASINLVAFGYGMKFLQEGDEILLTQAEHASNVLPWFKVAEVTKARIKYIPLDHQGRLTPENLRKTINKKTKIVAVAHVTNVLGYVVDIKKIAEICHEFGALIVVDGAQSVPHMPTDVVDWDLDFLSFSGHKMCGPTGVGVLYGKYHLLEAMDPLMTGGGQTAKFDMCGDVNFLLPPAKFEAGTANIAGIIGLKAAVEYLSKIGMERISAMEKELHQYAIKKMKKLDDVIIYNPDAEGGILSFNIKDVFAQDVATYFNAKGIAVRSGQHCAQILIDYLQTVATVRASWYFYNTKEDIDRFVEVCEKARNYLDAFFG